MMVEDKNEPNQHSKEAIYLMMFFDDAFFKYAVVCLDSIIKNTNKDIVLFFDGDISQNNYDILNGFSDRLFVNRLDGVQFISDKLYKGGNRWPSVILNRIFAPFMLPDYVKRCLYLDVDVIVETDLYPFQEINIFDNTIGAVSGWHGFNTGVILFDIDRLKRKYSESLFINYIYTLTPPFNDQEILGCMFKDDFCSLPSDYNYRAWNTFLWKNPLKNSAKIIHYLGKIKPDNYKWIEWKANKPFWKYARKHYGCCYRIKIAIKSFFWYPIALYKRFRYHTGRGD